MVWEGGASGELWPPPDFEIISKKRLFLQFRGVKTNFTTFGPPWKKFGENLLLAPSPGKNPSEAHAPDPYFIKKPQTRDLKICRLCRNVSKNFQKVSSPIRSWNFSNNWRFSHLLVLFLTCRYNRHVELKNFTKPYRCSSQSLKKKKAWDRDL